MSESSRHELHLGDFQSFRCTACGLCCTRPWGITVEPEVEAGIRDSQLYQQRVREGYQPLEVYVEGPVRTNRQRNGSCMFLTDDLLCGLHKELGSQGKPVGCQMYPYRAVRTPSGTFVSLSFACPTVVAGTDRNWQQSYDALSATLTRFPEAAGDLCQKELPVQVTLDRQISWNSYLLLENRLLASYDAERPLESLLELATCVANLSRENGKESWPILDNPVLPVQSVKDLMKTYLTAIVSILENEHNPLLRAAYGQSLDSCQRLPSAYFAGQLPPLDLDRTLPNWARQTYHRYFRNALLGKSILGPSVVSRLLAMGIGYALLALYAEGFRQVREEEELSLQSLTLAFEVVDGDAISHSQPMTRFFDDFEQTLLKYIFL